MTPRDLPQTPQGQLECSNRLVSNPRSHYTAATTPVAATRTMQEWTCAAARSAQPDGSMELADASFDELAPGGACSRLRVALVLPGRQPGHLVAQPRDLARRGHVHRPGRQSLLRPGVYHVGLVSKPRHAVRREQSALLALPLPVDPCFRLRRGVGSRAELRAHPCRGRV